MTISRKLIFLFSFFILTILYGEAQETPPIRSFDSSQVEELQEKHPYEVAEPVPEGAFQRLWNRFKNWVIKLFTSNTTGNILEILFKLLLLAAFVFFIIKLSGTEISSVFKPAKPNINLEVDEEHLAEIDFDTAISQARQTQDWRLTVRLIYLKSLKFLWEKEVISVRKGKTNREYLYELNGKSLATDFERLSFLFDYTWYGHFDATEQHVQKAENYCSNILEGRKNEG